MQVNIEGVIIERVSEIKFLGVTIDERISWKPHIKHVQNKLSRTFTRFKITMYSLLFTCTTVYKLEIWGNNYKNSIHSLITLQKKAIRIIHKAGFLEHTNSLFLRSR